jgi:hypothetical protein
VILSIFNFNVKRFIFQSFKFLALAFILLNIAGWLLLKFHAQGAAVENGFIYKSIAKARQEFPDTEIFLLGDSVAAQMYPPEKYSGRINSFALVVPVTLAGQYFLLKRISEQNDLKGKEILLLLTPSGLKMDFAHDPTYHYILKPFYNREFSPWQYDLFSQTIKNRWVAMLSQLPMIKCSNWIPPIGYLNPIYANGKGVTDVNREFVLKIKQLVEEKGGKLKIRCTVLPHSQRDTFENSLLSDFKTMDIDKAFQGYLESAHFLEDGLFSDDKVHLNTPEKMQNNFLNF